MFISSFFANRIFIPLKSFLLLFIQTIHVYRNVAYININSSHTIQLRVINWSITRQINFSRIWAWKIYFVKHIVIETKYLSQLRYWCLFAEVLCAGLQSVMCCFTLFDAALQSYYMMLSSIWFYFSGVWCCLSRFDAAFQSYYLLIGSVWCCLARFGAALKSCYMLLCSVLYYLVRIGAALSSYYMLLCRVITF